MIPEKWYIKRTKETCGEVNAYFSTLYGVKFSANGQWWASRGVDKPPYGPRNGDFLHFPRKNGKTRDYYPFEGYTEISFEQFKKYIVNKEKEIPEEYIVHLEKADNYNDFRDWYNSKYSSINANIGGMNGWYYKIPYTGNTNDTDINLLIINNNKNLPVISYKEWQETILNNNTETNKTENMENKELIAYRLKKDLPLIKAGAEYKKNGNNWEYDYGNSTFDFYTDAQIVNLFDWFEPVYEEVIKINNYELEVNDNNSINFGCKNFQKSELEAYSKLLASTHSIITVEGTNLTISLLSKILSKLK